MPAPPDPGASKRTRRPLFALALAAAAVGCALWWLLPEGPAARPALDAGEAPVTPGRDDQRPRELAERERRLAAADRRAAAPRDLASPAAAAPPVPGAAARPTSAPAIGASATTAGPPPRLEILDPPEDAPDPVDRTARVAAQAYHNVVRAMQLDAVQEERFRQLLFDAQQANATAVGREGWEEQKRLGDEQMKQVLSERQLQVYTTVVQNPLFLASGLKFRVNAETPAGAR